MAIEKAFDELTKDSISRRNLLKAGAIVTAGIAGASLAGCISNGPSATPTPAPTVAPTDKPLAKVDTLKVGYLPSDHQSSLFVAKTKGYFDKYKQGTEFTKFDSGANILKQIASGALDIGLVGVPSVVMYVDKGTPAKIIAPIHQNGSALIVKKGSGITDINGLKGKKIAIPSQASIQDVYLRQVLTENGIDYAKDINVVVVPAGQIVGALTQGTVDAAFPWEPFITLAVQQNVADVLFWTNDKFPHHPCCSIVATNDIVSKAPGSIVSFLEAHRDGTNFVNANLLDTAQIAGSSEWLNLDVDVEKSSISHAEFIYKPEETFVAGTEKFASDLKKLGTVTQTLTRNELFDFTYLNKVIASPVSSLKSE